VRVVEVVDMLGLQLMSVCVSKCCRYSEGNNCYPVPNCLFYTHVYRLSVFLHVSLFYLV